MDKYKYQILIIIMILCIGGVVGYFLAKPSDTAIQKLVEDRVKELAQQNVKSQQRIDSMELALNKIKVKDSIYEVKKKDLLVRIKRDSIKMVKLLNKIPQMTPDEKSTWLINRYRTQSSR